MHECVVGVLAFMDEAVCDIVGSVSICNPKGALDGVGVVNASEDRYDSHRKGLQELGRMVELPTWSCIELSPWDW